ncbi:polyketide synthase [Hymenobacter nivis]|uniref:Type I polyketide synthase n=1 Tax=Hymenobacter nivis TaxID=1850093 RepID=A0A2Z3GHV9_9BACT|nr:polyketide synthase [Hymenobacter nivis]AWM32568.1 type I polyketide synthase [Hymenobacter nivis]
MDAILVGGLVTNEAQGPELVHRLVEQAAATYADRPAVVFGNQALTYQQLNDQAEALSQTLLREAPDAGLIGISSTRDLDLIVRVLAILKSGKAYLPLDPGYPAARLQQIITDSGIRFGLASGDDVSVMESHGLQVISALTSADFSSRLIARPGPLACVLYTSGSTGKPKGVQVRHESAVNFLRCQLAHGVAQPGVNSSLFSPLSFDVSFQEIFVPLVTGGTVYPLSDAVRLDSNQLLRFLIDAGINRAFLPYGALQYLAEAADAESCYPTALREVITGSEVIRLTPLITRFFAAMPACTLMIGYGPTEATVWVTEHRLTGDPQNWPVLPNIGKSIAGTEIFILDEEGQPAPNGALGEISITGICLAAGYLNQPERTAERFIQWQHPQKGSVILYRTGDLGRYLPDGALEFSGRRDGQVKIRGYRVELGEIELALAQQPGVRQAVAVVREDVPGQQRLVAYVATGPNAADLADLRRALTQRLPAFMVPAHIIGLDRLPETPSGKIDRSALPKPDANRPDLGVIYRNPVTVVEKAVASVWAALLQIDKIGLDDNFFELGGNSLLAQRTVTDLKARFSYVLPITKLYQYPTVASLAPYFGQADGAPSLFRALTHKTNSNLTDIAVIGMAGRFPGANTIEELWEVLKNGRETIRFFTLDKIDSSVPEALRNDPAYVPARGIIDQADQFDAGFFGLTPKLAEAMDPQHRIFLEIAWEALEQTGHLPTHYAGRVGVFAGCGYNTYFLNNVLANPDHVEQVGSVQVMLANEKDYIATRTAYQLDLKGPAVSVHSACSTSLLAIAQAVQSIRSGQCEVALAGGTSITAPVRSGHLYQEGSMLSADGHCRPFDANARGTVFSDGAGVVVLKDAAAARRDGDTIYAVIKGVGVNNDGGGKGSFTAPNADGQAGAIRMALADAGVAPATLSYVEAHGTATPVGDPIEMEGLISAFGEQAERQFCALGSIKSNMGHLTAAAGVAGFIKTALALHHRQIPASLGYAVPNSLIDFANSPFFVNTALADWPAGAGPRRAGVSSFGVGGTNVHVIVEEAGPPADAPGAPAPARPAELVVWSAKSTASREAYAQRLADALAVPDAPVLADVAFTLPTTRAPFEHRRFAIAADGPELRAQLQAPAAAGTAGALAAAPGDLFFLFPGQGAQYVGMGRELYDHEPAYRAAVDECAALLGPHLPTDLRAVLFAEPDNAAAEARLRDTRYAQPALFVTEYALARLWASWGVVPTGYCGHSVGEFVAAHLAGVFSLADALALVATRGRLVSALPGGSMLSVRLAANRLAALLPAGLSVAAQNGPAAAVVAGPAEAVACFARTLDAQDVPNRVLATSHAFHSAMMDPAVEAFQQALANVPLHRPQKPVVSTVSGTWLTDAQATDPNYWAAHLRQTVQFTAALDTLLAEQQPILLEVGPGHVLSALAQQQLAGRPAAVLASLKKGPGPHPEYRALLGALGQLWLRGVAPDWAAVHAGRNPRRVLLPTYAFDRKHCWLAPTAVAPVPAAAPPITIVAPPAASAAGAPVSFIPLVIPMRKSILLTTLSEVLENSSGIEMAGVSPDLTFLEIGFDSLLITQLALTIKKQFGLPITFRQLNESYATPNQLADYLDQALPPAAYQPAAAVPAPAPVPVPAAAAAPAPPVGAPVAFAPLAETGADSALGLIAQQLQILAKQMALLQGTGATPMAALAPLPAAAPAPATGAPASVPVAGAPVATPQITAEEAVEIKKPFGASPRIEKQASQLTGRQQVFLRDLTMRYTQKTKASKAYTQQHRARMADPRVVSGFRPLTKELVYPLVVDRSKGSKLWDLDGNEYLDVLNGFGSCMFGHQPAFIAEALHAQIERGYEVGPQHALAGEVSDLVCEFTGADRVALCSTGSEAVLGAMRIARTATGRSLVVAFTGSYHGIIDEVLVRGTKALKSFPAAAGIMPEAVQNMLILDYGTDESLRIITERASELAAVLVEPVQSRRPEFQPVAYLQQLRAVTAAAGTVLIFDEIITGFRLHPGGAQALFGIQADLATYGKVVGGGLPIGVIAGQRALMDALDGGGWQFGDDSVPEVGVTYFAGTFVRHPLALAAARASLLHMKAQGPALQQGLTAKATRLADLLNQAFAQQQLPFFVAQFGSLWKIKFREEVPYSELMFTLLREKGLHIWDGFPCFMTEAHTDADVTLIADLLLASVREMQEAGFFSAALAPGPVPAAHSSALSLNQPPAPGARLGRDRNGNPAWFIANGQAGEYIQVDL